MSTSSQLFEVYVLLQDLMKEHVNINQCLKEISSQNPPAYDFQRIATCAQSIVESCEEMKKILTPTACNCCKLIPTTLQDSSQLLDDCL